MRLCLRPSLILILRLFFFAPFFGLGFGLDSLFGPLRLFLGGGDFVGFFVGGAFFGGGGGGAFFFVGGAFFGGGGGGAFLPFGGGGGGGGAFLPFGGGGGGGGAFFAIPNAPCKH